MGTFSEKNGPTRTANTFGKIARKNGEPALTKLTELQTVVRLFWRVTPADHRKSASKKEKQDTRWPATGASHQGAQHGNDKDEARQTKHNSNQTPTTRRDDEPTQQTKKQEQTNRATTTPENVANKLLDSAMAIDESNAPTRLRHRYKH